MPDKLKAQVGYNFHFSLKGILVSCWFKGIVLQWSGGAMVLGKFPVPGRPTNLE